MWWWDAACAMGWPHSWGSLTKWERLGVQRVAA